MKKSKLFFTAVCALLCAFLLLGFGAYADSAPLATLHLEKNGLPLDLSLLKIALEDGNLELSVGIDGITGWKEETPPKLIVSFKEGGRKFTLDLFSSETAKSLPDSAKNYKMSTKLPYDGGAFPDQFLVDIGEGEPLVFWPGGGAPVEAAADSTPADDSTPAPVSSSAADTEIDLTEAKALLDEGKYYEAALAIKAAEDEAPTEECEALMAQIAGKLADKEPKTGELERHFPFYGINCVRATAESGPFEMIITDTENSSLYTRFYVRQGETSEVYLPSSIYTAVIKMGDIWFGDDIGFGELCESSDFDGDTLDMTSRAKGNTLSYHEWEPVF